MQDGIIFRTALWVMPTLSGALAFSVSARAHVLDVLLGQADCGKLFMKPAAPVLFGHCLECWTAGATAGAAMLIALLVAHLFYTSQRLAA